MGPCPFHPLLSSLFFFPFSLPLSSLHFRPSLYVTSLSRKVPSLRSAREYGERGVLPSGSDKRFLMHLKITLLAQVFMHCDPHTPCDILVWCFSQKNLRF